MTLERHLDDILDELVASDRAMDRHRLIQCMDLTLLKEDASEEALRSLLLQAQTHEIAAVCVYTKHLSHFKQSKPTFKLATVLNFPEGQTDLAGCYRAIEQALAIGLQEVDYVFPYAQYLKGEKQRALDHCRSLLEACKKQGLTFKVIMETGVFPDMYTLREASTELILMGCDFLKTSTGTIAQGASFSAVFAMLTAIKDSGRSCGIKVSGGVKSPKQAHNYACLAELMMGRVIDKDWFRIGASSLLERLV